MSQPVKTSTLAIVALVCAFFCQPLGLILGIIALVQISNSNGAMKGQGLAVAAIVLGAMMFIIGILAAIAIPNFIRYQMRAKQSEARVMLSSIRNSQEAFRMENNIYVAATPDGGNRGTELGPWEGRPCSDACPSDPSACTEFSCMGFSSSTPTYHRLACTTIGGEEPAFTCASVGDLDGDGQSSVWLTSSGPAPLPAIATEAGCMDQPPTDGVYECTLGAF